MRGFSRTSALGVLLLTFAAGCSDADIDTSISAENEVVAELGAEDGLAQAYGIFKAKFEQEREHLSYHVSFGMNPLVSDVAVTLDQKGNIPVNGQLTIDYATGTVAASLNGPKPGSTFAGRRFDLWLVRNVVGSVRPETLKRTDGSTQSDEFLLLGTFDAGDTNGVQRLVPRADLSADAVKNFDLDLVVLVAQGQPDPTQNIHATGARTLFEKRYFREAKGRALDNPVGTRSTAIETKDRLVQRGAHLFFKETFEGNGRTCSTCHRAEDNMTISPAFIKTLSTDDPLFANLPAGLEDPDLLKEGMFRENVDGMDDPTRKFVARSASHTLGLSASLGAIITGKGQNNLPPQIGQFADGPGPDQRTGWSGDGAPGRGTLTEFAMGAIFQHFPKALTREKSGPNKSFRLPTQEELYALEAFQLFLGRQRAINTAALTFNDPIAERGKNFAFGAGQCVACHQDIRGENFSNFDFNTNVEVLSAPFETSTNMPTDGGFGVLTGFKPSTSPGVPSSGGEPGSIQTGFGDGQFNVPPLFEAADTGPWFHKNNFLGDIESAVGFYGTGQFLGSPAVQFAAPQLRSSQTSIPDLGAYLRTINALTNIAQVYKRVKFVEVNRQTNGGNFPIVTIALEDLNDAISVLGGPLAGTATTIQALEFLNKAKAELEKAKKRADSARGPLMKVAAENLQKAKDTLRTQTPNAIASGMDF